MHCLDKWKHWLLHRVVDPVQSFIKNSIITLLEIVNRLTCSPLKGIDESGPIQKILNLVRKVCESRWWSSLQAFKTDSSITFFDFAAFLRWSPRVKSAIDRAKIFFLLPKHESLNLKFSSARPLSLRPAPMHSSAEHPIMELELTSPPTKIFICSMQLQKLEKLKWHLEEFKPQRNTSITLSHETRFGQKRELYNGLLSCIWLLFLTIMNYYDSYYHCYDFVMNITIIMNIILTISSLSLWSFYDYYYYVHHDRFDYPLLGRPRKLVNG